MIDSVFWWTGLVCCLLICCLVWLLLLEVLWGFVLACSWIRWSVLMMRTHGRLPRWKHLPRAFINRWIDFIGYRNDGSTAYHGNGGRWNGYGDWVVFPKREDAQ